MAITFYVVLHCPSAHIRIAGARSTLMRTESIKRKRCSLNLFIHSSPIDDARRFGSRSSTTNSTINKQTISILKALINARIQKKKRKRIKTAHRKKAHTHTTNMLIIKGRKKPNFFWIATKIIENRISSFCSAMNASEHSKMQFFVVGKFPNCFPFFRLTVAYLIESPVINQLHHSIGLMFWCVYALVAITAEMMHHNSQKTKSNGN